MKINSAHLDFIRVALALAVIGLAPAVSGAAPDAPKRPGTAFQRGLKLFLQRDVDVITVTDMTAGGKTYLSAGGSRSAMPPNRIHGDPAAGASPSFLS